MSIGHLLRSSDEPFRGGLLARQFYLKTTPEFISGDALFNLKLSLDYAWSEFVVFDGDAICSDMNIDKNSNTYKYIKSKFIFSCLAKGKLPIDFTSHDPSFSSDYLNEISDSIDNGFKGNVFVNHEQLARVRNILMSKS